MNILILNWRDIKNPKSGGAEILTHEIAKRWVKMGHKVIQFSSFYPKGLREEIVDGVQIIRKGHPDARYLFFSVHFLAFLQYFKFYKGKMDVVIDEIHGLPFFTPWYIKEKKIALICEVSGNLWKKMFGVFFGMIGKSAEKFYMKIVYKNIKFMAISPSTKNELVREGVKKGNIFVLPMGLTYPKKLKTQKKEKNPTMVFVGRLSPSKGVEDAIHAVNEIKKMLPKVRLWIVGSGLREYELSLKKLVKKLKLKDAVIFFGFVADRKKFNLMSRAHFLVAPSVKEGWGLIVPEAGLVGTPSIGYKTEGIRDVIKDGKTGYLVNGPKNYVGLAETIRKAFQDKKNYKSMSKESMKLSRLYDWNKTAREAMKVISA